METRAQVIISKAPNRLHWQLMVIDFESTLPTEASEFSYGTMVLLPWEESFQVRGKLQER